MVRISPAVACLFALFLSACSTPKQEVVVEDAAVVEPVPVPTEVSNAQRASAEALAAGDHQQALTALRDVTSHYPQYPGPFLNLGIAHLGLKQDEQAAKAFRAALQIDAGNSVAHNYLGILQRRAGQFAKAKESYQRAISADESYSLAHLNLGILCDIYLQDLDCALQHYTAYEARQENVDKQFKGWKIDLERRIKSRKSAQ